MTLYEMNDIARSLYEMLESGEIDEQTLSDTMESIGAGEKADIYCRIIRQFQSDITALKAERDRLDAKRKTAESAVERMKSALLMFTETCGGKVRTPLFTIYTRSTQHVEITDPDAVPVYYTVAQPPKIAVAEISKALKNGDIVPGAMLVSGTSVIIR